MAFQLRAKWVNADQRTLLSEARFGPSHAFWRALGPPLCIWRVGSDIFNGFDNYFTPCKPLLARGLFLMRLLQKQNRFVRSDERFDQIGHVNDC